MYVNIYFSLSAYEYLYLWVVLRKTLQIKETMTIYRYFYGPTYCSGKRDFSFR